MIMFTVTVHHTRASQSCSQGMRRVHPLLQQAREGDRGSEGLGSPFRGMATPEKAEKKTLLWFFLPVLENKSACCNVYPLRQSPCCLPDWIPKAGLVMYTHLLYSLSGLPLHAERYPSPEDQTVLVWLWKKQSKTPSEIHSVPNYRSKYQHVYSHVDLIQHPRCLRRRKVVCIQLISSSMWHSWFWQVRWVNSAAAPWHALGFAFVFALVPYGVEPVFEHPISPCFWRKHWQNK